MNIAISAYVCSSNQGSEHEIGWKCVKEYAQIADNLYLFTSANENFDLNFQMDANSLYNVKLFMVDIPIKLNNYLKSIPIIGYHLAAYLWELSLFFYLIKRYEKGFFDLAIKSSYGTYRYPSFLWYFSKELHLNPISGGGRLPFRFLSFFSLKGKLIELFRMIMQVSPFANPLVLLTLSKSSKIYVGFNATKAILPKFAKKKCLLKENFLEVFPEDFRMKEAKEISQLDKFKLKLFYTGRIHEWKGVMITLRALKKIGPEINYEFTIMGEGPTKRLLKKYSENHNLNVIFINPKNIPRCDLSFYYYSHDIFIFPTLHGEAGFAPIEAKLHDMTLLTLDFSGLEAHVDQGDIVIDTRAKDAEGVVDDVARQLSLYYKKKVTSSHND